MRLLFSLLIILFFTTQSLRAADEPLRVAIDPTNPPFVMRGANNQFFGYDISMMEYICHTLQRKCQFVPIRFDKILEAVKNNQVDVAISSITITLPRAEVVNFSLPYLLSKARFIGPKALAAKPFTLRLLNGKKIGITEGSIYSSIIQEMGVQNPVIVPFTNLNYLIDALNKGKINFGLLDEPSAMYWQSQSSGKLAALGEEINSGGGMGIAVNQDNVALLRAINNAILHYQDSTDFQINYHTYMTHF